ncbi:MAG: 30S ribosomal protein S6 [Candidatus Firestonebacteria bacterium]|nr:30S ribosomal protein S6 [Candidatus Firestonebacteria bacterium]
MQTPYETMFLMPSSVTLEQVDELIDRIKKSLEKKHGEVTNVDKMGVRKTAYAVRKQNTAYYVLLQFRGSGESFREVERTLKNADNVWKFLSTKVTTKAAPPSKPSSKPVEVAPAAEPAAASAEPAAGDAGAPKE